MVQSPHIFKVEIPKILTTKGPTTAPSPYMPYEKLTACLGSYLTVYIKRTLIKTSIEPIERFIKNEINASIVEFS